MASTIDNADSTSKDEIFQDDIYSSDNEDFPLFFRITSKFRQCRKRTRGYTVDSDVSTDDEYKHTIKRTKKFKQKIQEDKDYKPTCRTAISEEYRNWWIDERGHFQVIKHFKKNKNAKLPRKNKFTFNIPPFCKKQKDTEISTNEYPLEENVEEVIKKNNETGEHNENLTGNENSSKKNENLMVCIFRIIKIYSFVKFLSHFKPVLNKLKFL